MGLDWKQESLCQVAQHAPIDEDKEVWVSGDVRVWAGHVTRQTCSPECAKAIFHLSLDGETTTPQPAIITSKTKALLLPNYFRDVVLHLTATGIIKK